MTIARKSIGSFLHVPSLSLRTSLFAFALLESIYATDTAPLFAQQTAAVTDLKTESPEPNGSPPEPASSPTPDPWLKATALLEQHCYSCHQGEQKEGNLDLQQYESIERIIADRPLWDTVRRRVLAGEMPPRDHEPMPVEDRQWLAHWVQTLFREFACQGKPQPGPNPLRRLNRNQYSNSIRDLLGIHFDAGHSLPIDGAGGEGFDNAAETLFLSPIHGEKYLEAAKEALDYSAKDESSRRLIFHKLPDANTTPVDAAKAVIGRFASRAFRRPASEVEIENLLKLYQTAMERQYSFEQAVYYALQGVLVSPQFLFLVEPAIEGTEVQPIDAYSFATRLSYFLWDSTPDQELLDRAADGSILKEDVYRDQVVRMLNSSKVRPMAESFIGQWLGTREIGRRIKPDSKLFSKFDDELAAAFREEPVLMFQHILKENRSLIELIDSDYIFVNSETFRFYGLKENRPENLVQNLEKCQLPPDHLRGGVITMAGPLTVSSYPNRTSPVLRGKWVLETILGAAPPPPPPKIETRSEKPEDTAGKTLRQRLEIHRQNPACASCHATLDPIGFGLENFDPIGRYRDKDNGLPIDSSGQLTSGETFQNARELKKLVLERKDQFVRHFTVKMLGYALGRGLVDSDYCIVDQLVADVKEHDYKIQRLMLGILRSPAMQLRPPREITTPLNTQTSNQ
jgi:hypothetical protein